MQTTLTRRPHQPSICRITPHLNTLQPHIRILLEGLMHQIQCPQLSTRGLRQYHPLFPILDPSIGPNNYYDQSPFLFWTIVVTGSRRYSEHEVLERTSQPITQLAFSSMALRTSQVPIIQGLLILCTWRLPTNSMYKDTTHLMCGSAVHLATQIGLHIAGVGQDFARTPLEKDQSLKVQRARLWLCCVIVSIR